MAGALAASFKFTNLSHPPHLLLLRSDQAPLRADARPRIPDYFAYGAAEGYSALEPVSEPVPAQGGSVLDSECVRTPSNIALLHRWRSAGL